ncbi:hypothetical protein D9757_007496 [Collybiopsis confluens]|uniref:Monothiol glutaredoxin-5, mitochondrial n=1 Tax=Collybiopsis confluens TaxID=2823264 RepID=A0A8H5HJR2_9AGAR|nr:hypothetical protein D9757_007496 [Collybiopsis confluens]
MRKIRRGRDTGGGWGKGKGVAVPSKREVIPGWEMERERAWLGYLEEEVRTTGTEVPATSTLVAGSNPDSKNSKVSGLETKLGESLTSGSSISQNLTTNMFRASLRSPLISLRPSAAKSLTGGRLIAARFLTQQARAQIQNAITSTPVVLFMKGTPDYPECGFSRATVQVLDLHGVPAEKMKTYNVLQDNELRQGIKEFSMWMSNAFFRDWPTIPQLYVNGEFVGGCDIILSMHQSGELHTLLESNQIVPKAEEAQAQAA